MFALWSTGLLLSLSLASLLLHSLLPAFLLTLLFSLQLLLFLALPLHLLFALLLLSFALYAKLFAAAGQDEQEGGEQGANRKKIRDPSHLSTSPYFSIR
ncbi:hypothetical protein BSNK01_04030 [Bacillaceae bacterium]